MSVPKFLQLALWSYDTDKIDPQRDKHLIITQVLNHGNWRQLQWLLKTYTTEDIKQIVLNPSRGVWLDDALNYWETVLEVKAPTDKRQRALFSLTPNNIPQPYD